MVRTPPPRLDTDVDVNTAQCGTVWGRSSFSHFTHTSLCQKSALLPFRKQNVRTNKQRCPSKDFSKKQKNEPSYQNTNFSLWTEPLWFLISPMIVAFPHQISPRPPPPHFRVFSQGRVLVFIKSSEVIRLSFLLLSRLWAAIGPSPPIYRSLRWTSSLTLWQQPCHRNANPPPSAPIADMQVGAEVLHDHHCYPWKMSQLLFFSDNSDISLILSLNYKTCVHAWVELSPQAPISVPFYSSKIFCLMLLTSLNISCISVLLIYLSFFFVWVGRHGKPDVCCQTLHFYGDL